MKTLLSLPESQWVGRYVSTRKWSEIQVEIEAAGGWCTLQYDESRQDKRRVRVFCKCYVVYV